MSVEVSLCGEDQHVGAVLLIERKFLRSLYVAHIAANDVPSECHWRMMRIGFGAANAVEELVKIERPDIGEKDEQTDDEARIANAVGNERLVGRVRGTLTLVVEAD